MKGGGIIGALGGLLGAGLLSKGGMSGAASLLGTLAKGAGKGSRGGMTSVISGMKGMGGGSGRGGGCGAGKGGRRGSGGQGGSNPLADALQDALKRLSEQNMPRSIADDGAARSLTGSENGIIDVQPAELPAGRDTGREALVILSRSLASYVPGRARVRHGALKGAGDRRALEQALRDSGFGEVTFNTSSGSALLTWDAASMDRRDFLMAALPLGQYLARHEMQEDA